MSTYSIKDMESLTGIKAHTIRIWEKRYSLIEPERTSTNIRLYNDDQLRHLINVSTLVNHGHKISKLSKLTKEEVNRLIESYATSDNSQTATISQMVDAMVKLDETSFNQLFNQSIQSLGFETTIIEVIFPLLQRIGSMWSIGSIIPGHEHFLSNLIRQKMMVNTHQLDTSIHPNLPTFVLFLPDGEWHEIGLLFMNYMLRKRGFPVIYLGASVRKVDLIEIFKTKDIKYLFTIITSSYGKLSTPVYLNDISKALKGKTLFVTGKAVEELESVPKNISVLANYQTTKTELQNLHEQYLKS